MTKMEPQISQNARRSGTLFVEARLIDSERRNCRSFGRIEEASLAVETWIQQNFAQITIGTSVPVSAVARSPLSLIVDRVEFTGHSKSKTSPDETSYSLADSNLEILVYSLFSDERPSSQAGEDECSDSSCPLFETTPLPHRAFEGLWETLIYEDPVSELTLRALTRAIKEQKDHPTVCVRRSWQNTVLFHGPAGSGKSSLAQALAHRLSIRLSKIFEASKLLQINAHALFSRFYGETTKKFGDLFSRILELAEDNDELVFVVFDEVETVAGARETSAQTNEPRETIRVDGSNFLCYSGLLTFIQGN